MDYASVRVCLVPWLGSRWTTAYILSVHDHRRLTNTGQRRSISGVALGVGRGIALVGRRSLALNDSTCDHAMHFEGILAALQAFADRGAALHAFSKSLSRLVKGMIAAERICYIALLVSWIIDRLVMDRPQTLLQFRWVRCIGDWQYERRRTDQHLFHLFPPVFVASPRYVGCNCITLGRPPCWIQTTACQQHR